MAQRAVIRSTAYRDHLGFEDNLLNNPVCTRRVTTKQPLVRIRAWVLLHSLIATSISLEAILSQPPQVSTMDANPKQEKWRDGVLSSLNAAIEAMNLAKEVASVTPAKAVFGSVSVLLTMIRVSVLFSD